MHRAVPVLGLCNATSSYVYYLYVVVFQHSQFVGSLPLAMRAQRGTSCKQRLAESAWCTNCSTNNKRKCTKQALEVATQTDDHPGLVTAGEYTVYAKSWLRVCDRVTN